MYTKNVSNEVTEKYHILSYSICAAYIVTPVQSISIKPYWAFRLDLLRQESFKDWLGIYFANISENKERIKRIAKNEKYGITWIFEEWMIVLFGKNTRYRPYSYTVLEYGSYG